MAGSAGTESLISILEGLCREHRAMCALLQEDNPRSAKSFRMVTRETPVIGEIDRRELPSTIADTIWTRLDVLSLFIATC